MMADLTEAGVEISYGKRALGISKGLLDDFLNVVAATVASELLDAFDGDYAPQFFCAGGT